MLLPSKKIICPFCFHDLSYQAINFRCLAPGCSGREKDTIFAEARGISAVVMGAVISPNGGRASTLPSQAICEHCQTVSKTRICGYCHFELSHDVGQVEQKIIAIIGGRATGKTHYIASLITRLQHDIGKDFDLTVRILGDQTQERWERDFYTPLFIQKTVLQPNRPAEVDPQIKAPLIFRLTISNGNTRKILNISFFDSAGEDMTSLNTMSIQNRYIIHSDGIIFLLDPLQIASVREQLPSVNIPLADALASPEYIVSRLRDLFEREHRLRPAQKVKVPIAFTLSKMDALFTLLEPGSEFHHPGDHPGYLDLDDTQSVHTEIANYLSLWINRNFRDVIDHNFARYNFFGVSSLGDQPDSNNRLATVNPLRVEDPFLWILYQLGFIKGKRRQ